jgi:uncharacterized protein (DUF433 family)
MMLLQELTEQACKLTPSDRALLIGALVDSLQQVETVPSWNYLVARAHPWRKQLYVKGTKLLASLVWQDALANQMSQEQVAENWDLSLVAIDEIWRYCEANRSLIEMEAKEESYRLAGVTRSYTSLI